MKELKNLLRNQRRTYVQEKKIENGPDRLHFLEKKANGLDKDRFVKAVHFLEKFDSRFQGIMYSSLITHLSVFTQTQFNHQKELPLWMDLVYHNLSSRKFSSPLKKNVEKMFSIFGFSLDAITDEIKSPQALYCLAEYNKIFKNLKDEKSTLFWKLKSFPLDYDEQIFLNLTNSLDIAREQKLLLLAKYAVDSMKNKKSLKKWKNFFDKEGMFSNENRNKENAHVYIQLLNCYNLCALRNEEWDLMGPSFEEIKKILPLLSPKMRAHLNGIYSYHRSMDKKQEKTKMVNYLFSAMSDDKGFFDYYYRMGNLFYEDNPEISKMCFEIAVATSPLSLEIINDYGCFLTEYHPEKAGQWEELILGIGLAQREDFE